MTQDELKALVGQAALQYIQPGTLVGVGTGSTVDKFIDALAAVKGSIAGAVSSSVASTERLQALLKARALDKFGDENRWQELAAHAPFHRVARVEEVSASAVFLASPRSSYTSGAVLVVDGGFSQRCNWWG